MLSVSDKSICTVQLSFVPSVGKSAICDDCALAHEGDEKLDMDGSVMRWSLEIEISNDGFGLEASAIPPSAATRNASSDPLASSFEEHCSVTICQTRRRIPY